MEDLKKNIQDIKESQIRIEIDLSYHIKRTDLLESQIQEQRKIMAPLYVLEWLKNNYRFIIFLASFIAGIVFIINKKI
ncbi:MAG: hypothetical protein Unbinned8261contig1001_4 [Prokaryotic dsDNA virus sp.]|nr:MAG: hypothetical protein Unbinned8261contig1001_4 [Prokaryotic dsDNA virus sp.]|tara:strand:+ start:15679 stop:15912 length:234 start_codon:yes stop_codon:yes gene_type:complete